MICGHPKNQIEENWSEKQKGTWLLCSACEAHTAVFKKKGDAYSALKRMQRPKPQGVREGGRPKELPDGAKLSNFMLGPLHKKTLDIYKKRNKLTSRAAALRHLLENLPASILADAAI